MRITPLDVRKQEFRRVVRGLDADEVHAFLATVADEYEIVLTDNKNLRERVMELDEKVAEYRNMERTLRDTLITAERVMSEARQNASKESELILRDAQLKANQETAGIATKVEALKTQLRELRGHRDSFMARLQSLSEAQIGLVDSYRTDFDNQDTRVETLMEDTIEVAELAPVQDAAPDPEAELPPPLVSNHEPEEMDLTPSIPVAPVAAAPAFSAPEQDQWRRYDVASSTSFVPPVSAPIPVVQTHSAPDPAPNYDSAPVAPVHFDPVENRPTQRVDPVQVPDTAYASETAYVDDALADRAVDEVSEALNVFDERRSDWPESPSYTPESFEASGQPSQPVATYPGVAPQEPAATGPEDAAADPYADPSPESPSPEHEADPNAPEGDSSSRWSLSKFTKGLASF